MRDVGGLNTKSNKSIRSLITFQKQIFNVETLPEDMLRVYTYLAAENGEEYALVTIFAMSTAIELHRAWHMTLLTKKILQEIKEVFDLKLTWELSVFNLKFHTKDGGYELHRKVPYDYDSEFQGRLIPKRKIRC
jgi:hypothetical protein